MFRTAEQKNFHQIVSAHMRRLDGPLLLEGGTGLGKTRAYLAAVMGAAVTGKRIAVVLPTHQLIDQLLASSDLTATRGDVSVAVFRPARSPARMFDKNYEANKQAALDAQVMVCTAASVIIDQRLGGEYNGSVDRDYIVFDEADQLPDMAALQSDFKIKAENLKELGLTLADPKSTLSSILAMRPRTIDPEIRAAAKVILEAMEEPTWFQQAGVSDEGDIVLTHRLPGRLLKKISNRSNVAFISATLTIGGKFNDFRNAMGIDSESPLSMVIEPQVHGSLDFRVQGFEVETPEWIDAVVAAVEQAEKPVLVATTSHDLSVELGQHIKGATVRGGVEESAAEAAARCTGVLIAAGAWAGLDTPLRWRSIVVPRVPFKKLDVIDGNATSSYLDARNTAVRRLRQVIGRGLRSPDARCSIYLLDKRVEKLMGFIPERFAGQWSSREFTEGGRREVALSESERRPEVRKAALKHYGLKCMTCNFSIRAECQLQVHHLDPIAEGVRKTRLEDLAVLCGNCHLLAHSTNPPKGLDELRLENASNTLIAA